MIAAEEAQPLSEAEYSEVERFGLHKPDGFFALEHIAFGFAVVIIGGVLAIAGAVALLWWVTS